jgi:hypothetical protein
MAEIAGAGALACACKAALPFRRIFLLKGFAVSRMGFLFAADRRHAGLLVVQTLDNALADTNLEPRDVPMQESVPAPNDPGGAHAKGYSADTGPDMTADADTEGPMPLRLRQIVGALRRALNKRRR